MAGEALPRSLVLTSDDRAIVVSRLARAVLRFQDSFLCSEGSPTGLLCQVWLPEVVENNEIVLKTKGLPFCVAGMGDLLALFRCISCRFAFGTNVQRTNTLGAPGRVFTSSEPEMCCNVQQYAKSAYLRKAEAEQCEVQSTLLLPIFISPMRSGCVGVLEVVQTSEDMAFVDVAALLSAALEKCDLYTCSVDSVKRRTPAAATTTHLLLPAQTGVLVRAPPGNTSEDDSGNGRGSAGDEAMADPAVLGGMVAADAREGMGGQDSGDGMSGDDDEDDEDDEDEDGMSDGMRRGKGGHGRSGKGKRRSGNPGKPGLRLTLADLQSQFGVGLKEAANRLGICPTTLKRACRRHGIQRWPRRQLQKVNKALDELEARQMMQPQQHLAPQPGAGGYDAGAPTADGSLPAGDTRWTTLAQFIPAYHSSALVGYNDQHLQLGPGAQGMALPWAAVGADGQQQQQQQQLLAAQQQLLLQQQQQQQQQAGVALGSGAATPAASRSSLPDGALAMAGGGMQGPAAMHEVSATSGASTLGQPPPQAQHARQAQQGSPNQRMLSADSASPQRHLPTQPHPAAFDMNLLQHNQRGGSLAAGPASLLQRPPLGGNGGLLSAEFALLQQQQQQQQQQAAGAAAAVPPSFLSHFGLTGTGGQLSNGPVVRLPNPASLAEAGGDSSGAVRSLSSLSVPSMHNAFMSASLGHPGMAGSSLRGSGVRGGSGNGRNMMGDDDQVGFLDSSVLELLLTEDQRDGLASSLRAGPVMLPSSSMALSHMGGPSSSDLMPSMGPMPAMPGVSTGFSGLSFMM